MRYMLILKGDPHPDEVAARDSELVAAMHRFGKELDEAGALIAAEGLQPTASAARVIATGGAKRVVDGPFAESKELIAGYYLIRAASLAEAVEWARRCPVELAVKPGQEAVVEVREVFDVPD
ncbi:YciI family protein [Nonomuraea sp. NPDC050536]|uniref:YciI family protein n=1 Tax=Nonomuraea sp. NPDC050536 TaxID=3364366 RepID=UPI0037C94E9A